jgi:hypothetical protein
MGDTLDMLACCRNWIYPVVCVIVIGALLFVLIPVPSASSQICVRSFYFRTCPTCVECCYSHITSQLPSLILSFPYIIPIFCACLKLAEPSWRWRRQAFPKYWDVYTIPRAITLQRAGNRQRSCNKETEENLKPRQTVEAAFWSSYQPDIWSLV